MKIYPYITDSQLTFGLFIDLLHEQIIRVDCHGFHADATIQLLKTGFKPTVILFNYIFDAVGHASLFPYYYYYHHQLSLISLSPIIIRNGLLLLVC